MNAATAFASDGNDRLIPRDGDHSLVERSGLDRRSIEQSRTELFRRLEGMSALPSLPRIPSRKFYRQ